ncbi:hypothetical protein [Chryseobacterium sp. SIMBA_028]|uniref:hypothetical protein n=1 Tax=Chryseobacterium sp. SIMBA_028 TaxID=3085771 RepID=UPI00397E1A94
MIKVRISDEMKAQAKIEAQKRDAFIKHHFEVDHLSPEERDELGFWGEFACSTALQQDWKQNIRENYLTIDSYDIIVNGKRTDVKTETVPEGFARKILSKEIDDDKAYGRRLINKGQFDLLSKYDLVIFGLFIREFPEVWYPLGYLETKIITDQYLPTYDRPFGGRYPFPASPVPTSLLKPFNDLLI